MSSTSLPTGARPFDDVLRERVDRRAALVRLSSFSATAFWLLKVSFADDARSAELARRTSPSTLTFREVDHGADEWVHVAPGYSATVLASWGDPVLADAPPFDPNAQSAAAQARQFGTENDFLAYMPLPRGSRNSEHGLLCVNHEASNPELMFTGLRRENALERISTEQLSIEMAAQGHSVIEIEKRDGVWRRVPKSVLNRRISATTTPIRLSGPAAGHARLKTSADPTGASVVGTLNCCSGGVTPWGTVLIGEENVNQYFHGDPSSTTEARNHARMATGTELEFAWHRIDPRFELGREPHEPNRFGWVVEYDPYDPRSTPVKRTALGRFKHEGATCVVDPDGRLVVYMGDDDEFEFVYKFVSKAAFDAENFERNRDLLDEGTLFVARFESDGTLRWLPLVHGVGALTAEHGFHSQADVLIEARHAGSLVGATPMDRPEDVETNPATGRVYVMCTKNKLRVEEEIDAANPRAANLRGHVIELEPARDDRGRAVHAAEVFRWEMFVLCGDPFLPLEDPARGAYHADVTKNGWLACPDNCAFDPAGRLWIGTDGMSRDGWCNGMYAMDTHGDGRALPRHFFRAPLGGEIAGPCFTPDGKTLFLSVQHPGQSNAFGKKVGSFDEPTTRFPDQRDDMPPRSSVMAIVRDDGGVVGG